MKNNYTLIGGIAIPKACSSTLSSRSLSTLVGKLKQTWSVINARL